MMVNNKYASHIKLKLLSEGISYDDTFLKRFSLEKEAMEKRRAYNDSDDNFLKRSIRVPQEIKIGGVVIAMNHKKNSKWRLIYDEAYFLCHETEVISMISFPRFPNFFNHKTKEGIECKKVANLYGGSSLAFFTPSTCYYFNKSFECKFCSLKPNRDNQTDYIYTISPSLASSVLKIGLETDKDILKQIMLVGGNTPNYDKGFLNHIKITEQLDATQKHLQENERLETHIATMPPNDLSLLDKVNNLNARITMNIEVFNDKLFEKICPGKAKNYGRKNLIKALEYGAKKIGQKRVHTILIAGLEPVKSTIQGIKELPERGITPIINVFHNDKGSQFEHHKRPKYEELLEIAYTLQETYQKYHLTPYWKGCGRNALDYEALNGWF